MFNDSSRHFKVDVIMLTYNHEKWVNSAIESVIEQTYTNWHLFIGDDCSTDNTIKIIESFVLKYPDKITFVKQKSNIGVTKNLNSILKLCKGDYIANLGGDDILMNNKIDKQIKFFIKNPNVTLLGHSCEIIDNNDNLKGLYPLSHHRKGIGNKNWIKYGMRHAAISIMWKNQCNDIYFNENLSFAADLYFFIQFLGDNGVYGYLDDVLIKYRKSENSVSEKYKTQCRNDMFFMYTILLPLNNYSKFGKEYLTGKYLDYLEFQNESSFFQNCSKLIKLLFNHPFELIFYYRFYILLKEKIATFFKNNMCI
jgi:glycosyltransferase involved in cell wall biosynthesis